MKNKKALVIALSAGLVLGGAFALDSDNLAYAAEGETTPVEDKETPDGTENPAGETEGTADGSEEKPADDKKEDDKKEDDKKEDDKKEDDKKEDDKKEDDK